MKTFFAFPALVLLLSACAGNDRMADEADRTEILNRSAVVQSVDMTTRQMLLVTDEGETVMMTAGPEVRNLDQVDAGDSVTLSYSQAVSLRMVDAETPTATMTVAGMAAAEKGDKPGAAAGQMTLMIVDFVDYDGATHVARFLDADGLVRFATVKPEMRAFAATRKTDDKVEITIEEAIAVAVVPAGM